ncbi:MAG: hypothetical protein GXP58_11490 [Deltaproteobacteria bacterium]|nr:hypothetical protein [Deltaproteobacteria bacterium]
MAPEHGGHAGIPEEAVDLELLRCKNSLYKRALENRISDTGNGYDKTPGNRHGLLVMMQN